MTETAVSPSPPRGEGRGEGETSAIPEAAEMPAFPPHRPSGPPSPRGGEGSFSLCGEGHLTKLLAWLSPSFPVGAFSYSHGLEAAIDRGLVTDRATMTGWIAGILEHGSGHVDGMLFAHAHAAVLAGDEAAFAWAVGRADAMRATSEMALESRTQGQAFLTAIRAAWPLPGIERWNAVIAATRRPVGYPVAVALATALAGVDVRSGLQAYLHAFAANLVSAGVRLVPLGQTDGQRALAALDPLVHDAAERALTTPIADLGSRTAAVDWTSMIHETQYTRLFRS